VDRTDPTLSLIFPGSPVFFFNAFVPKLKEGLLHPAPDFFFFPISCPPGEQVFPFFFPAPPRVTQYHLGRAYCTLPGICCRTSSTDLFWFASPLYASVIFPALVRSVKKAFNSFSTTRWQSATFLPSFLQLFIRLFHYFFFPLTSPFDRLPSLGRPCEQADRVTCRWFPLPKSIPCLTRQVPVSP